MPGEIARSIEGGCWSPGNNPREEGICSSETDHATPTYITCITFRAERPCEQHTPGQFRFAAPFTIPWEDCARDVHLVNLPCHKLIAEMCAEGQQSRCCGLIVCARHLYCCYRFLTTRLVPADRLAPIIRLKPQIHTRMCRGRLATRRRCPTLILDQNAPIGLAGVTSRLTKIDEGPATQGSRRPCSERPSESSALHHPVVAGRAKFGHFWPDIIL